MELRTKTSAALAIVCAMLHSGGYTFKEKQYKNSIEVNSLDEAGLRLFLQDRLDAHKFDFKNDFVLLNGNSVYSFELLKKEIASLKKAKGEVKKISKYFYQFMSLNFTIAHYNIHGWLAEYPTWEEMQAQVRCVPMWKSDVNRIVRELF